MKKMQYYSLVLIIVLMGCSYNGQKSRTTGELEHKKVSVDSPKLDFNQTIDSITKTYVHLTTPKELSFVKGFISIYDNSAIYKEEDLEFISDSSKSIDKKSVAIFAM